MGESRPSKNNGRSAQKIMWRFSINTISRLHFCVWKFGGVLNFLSEAAAAWLRKRTHGKEYTAAVEEWCIVLSLIFLQFILGFQPCHTPRNWRSFSICCWHNLHTLLAVINCKSELEQSHSPRLFSLWGIQQLILFEVTIAFLQSEFGSLNSPSIWEGTKPFQRFIWVLKLSKLDRAYHSSPQPS